jgi:hypothetical protein
MKQEQSCDKKINRNTFFCRPDVRNVDWDSGRHLRHDDGGENDENGVVVFHSLPLGTEFTDLGRVDCLRTASFLWSAGCCIRVADFLLVALFVLIHPSPALFDIKRHRKCIGNSMIGPSDGIADELVLEVVVDAGKKIAFLARGILGLDHARVTIELNSKSGRFKTCLCQGKTRKHLRHLWLDGRSGVFSLVEFVFINLCSGNKI